MGDIVGCTREDSTDVEPYEVLGVPADADDAQVRAAYRRLVREHHPDRHVGGSAAEQEAAARRMAEVTEAYQLLSDPDAMTRRRLRTHWASGTGGPPPPTPSDPAAFDYRRAAPSEFTTGPSDRWGQTPPTPTPPPAPDTRDRGANRVFVWLLVVTVAVLAAVVLLG